MAAAADDPPPAAAEASLRASAKAGAKPRPPLPRIKEIKDVPGELLKSSILEDYGKARGEAIPLTKAANHDAFMRYFRMGDPDFDPQKKATARVSLWRLLSYSTWKERWLMILGVLLATVSGLGLPAWLVLLAQSLDTFSNLGTLISRLGSDGLMDVLKQELLNLCIAFAIVGVVVLFTGAGYVSIWTYTGEKQALRIQTKFLRASLNQDAAWFDNNDREALPTKMSTALVHINNAIGRQVADVYSNAISAIGCLVVALILNLPLSLIMLCVVPIAVIILGLFNMCIRRVKKRADKDMAEAGGIATEVVAGIKTVASLCAQPFFRDQYQSHVNESARMSIRAASLSSLLAGITGALFYITYTIAFVIGTEQVIECTAIELLPI